MCVCVSSSSTRYVLLSSSGAVKAHKSDSSSPGLLEVWRIYDGVSEKERKERKEERVGGSERERGRDGELMS